MGPKKNSSSNSFSPFVFPDESSEILMCFDSYLEQFEAFYKKTCIVDLTLDASDSKRDVLLSVLGSEALNALRETLESPETENYDLIIAAFRAKYATPHSTFKALRQFRSLVQEENEDLESFVARVSRQSLLIRSACEADRNLSALQQVLLGMRCEELRNKSLSQEWDLEAILENKDSCITNETSFDFNSLGISPCLIIKKNNKEIQLKEALKPIVDDVESFSENEEEEEDDEEEEEDENVEDDNEEDDEDDDVYDPNDIKEEPSEDNSTLNDDDKSMTFSGITITLESSKDDDLTSEKFAKKRRVVENMFKDIKNSSKEFKFKKTEEGKKSNSFYRHSSLVKKVKAMTCHYCSSSFVERKDWYAHKTRVCGACHKCFNKKSELAIHLVEAHGDTSNQCALCGKVYSSKGGLELHVQIVHDKNETYKCTYCPRGFPIERLLVNHIRRIHIRERKYSCEICGKGFETNGLLTKHINAVHEKKVAAICHICSKSFTSESCYRAHVLRVHENIRKFECEVCFARFHANADLQKHRKGVHDKILDYICEHCNKGFSRNSILQKHIKSIHTQQRDYQCGLCPNAYVSRYNLLRHIQEAHEHVKQECDICHREIAGFGAGNMAKHKRTAHGVVTIRNGTTTILP